MLSRITWPTEGSAQLQGRVRALLEVGTGFHPELTGRENIYLNGALLGMKKTEINRKMKEIIDFAEIEKSLDTPVKRYSTGMYVRLGFAVAAHLEPDILIIDEVLSVGDIGFQKKCMRRMERAAHEGKTVIVVSHNMNVVRRMCSTAMLLDQGKIVARGPVDPVVNQYLSTHAVDASDKNIEEADYLNKGTKLRITHVRLVKGVMRSLVPLFR